MLESSLCCQSFFFGNKCKVPVFFLRKTSVSNNQEHDIMISIYLSKPLNNVYPASKSTVDPDTPPPVHQMHDRVTRCTCTQQSAHRMHGQPPVQPTAAHRLLPRVVLAQKHTGRMHSRFSSSSLYRLATASLPSQLANR
jgi:hypothetical protein